MTRRNPIEDRARLIYDFLREQEQGYRIGTLCWRLGIRDDSRTRSAIREARDMATRDGLHFPPAVAPDFLYRVTALPGHALKPAVQMARIETGVRARKNDGLEFIEGRLRDVPAEVRPVAKAFVRIQRRAFQAQVEIQREVDDMMVEMVKLLHKEGSSK